MLSRIANFDDLDPLKAGAGRDPANSATRPAAAGRCHAGHPPGAKSTLGDMGSCGRQGWDIDILAHLRRGGACWAFAAVIRCLERLSLTPTGSRGSAGETAGLGFLDVTTVMTADKRLSRTQATHATSGLPISAYEIHIGRSHGADCARPFATIDSRPEGAMSEDRCVMGSYLHGMFT